MLLTHNPNDKEIGDSLSHQIATKVALLDKRLPEPLPYVDYFGDESSPERIWKMLYSFRSAIAHGDNPDFKAKLRMLRSAKSATSFVGEATARLLRQALEEPELFDSLKPI